MFRDNLRDKLTLTFDGQQLPPGVVVEGINRDFYPQITNITTDLPGMDGVLFRRRNIGSREVEVAVRVIEDRVHLASESRSRLREKIHEMRQYFDSTEPKRLWCSDQPTTYDRAILTSIDGHVGRTNLKISAKFLLPEGFSRSLHPIVREVPEEGKINLVYNGDFLTPIAITGTATAQTVILANAATNDRMTITTAKTGGVITIDSATETYREDGNLAQYKVPVTSDYLYITPGANDLAFSGLKDVVITFEARYL